MAHKLTTATVQCICNDKKYGKNPISIKCRHKRRGPGVIMHPKHTFNSTEISSRLWTNLHDLLVIGYLRKEGILSSKPPITIKRHLTEQLIDWKSANKHESGIYFAANVIRPFPIWGTSQIYPRK